MSSLRNISEVQTTIVLRLPSGLPELDWLYGVSQCPGSVAWGIPMAAISLWAGKPGIGKSRAAIEIAKKVARKGYRVIYFQNEVDLGTFASWVRRDGGVMPANLYISDSTQLSEQIADIHTVRPNLVIVDSINMLEDFRNGSDKSIKEIVAAYREVCKETGCHIIVLSQLTKAGDPRGSFVLPHLVDIVFEVVPMASDGFAIRVGSKHRYGRTGDNFTSWWVHTAKGCYCESKFRYEDKLWCQTTGSKYRDLRAECEAERQKMVAEWNKQFEPKAWWRRVLEW
jgi:predicted ATP-dependent serine protease